MEKLENEKDLSSSKNIPTIGIIGNLGPKTTAKLYLKLTEKFKGAYPSISIVCPQFSKKLEKDIIIDCKNENQLLPRLIESCKRLEKSGADFIVLPCNTLHIFINKLRNSVSIPIISIVEAVAKESKKYIKVGLLATNMTAKKHLYRNAVVPNNQNKVSESIINILSGKNNKTELIKAIKNLEHQGVEAIILGCTDLQLVIKESDSKVRLIDSFEILVNETIKTQKQIISDNYAKY